jgi:hypothetical protein
MTDKKPKKDTQKLTAHGLLGAVSYWGTAARFLLVGTLIVFAFILNLSGDSTATYIDTEILFLIYGLATLVMLDLGYVTAARALPLSKVFDRWVVMMSDVVLAAFFLVPSIIQTTADGNKVRVVSLIAALLVVAVRILIGLLFSKRK